jgi:Sigma-70, region 4
VRCLPRSAGGGFLRLSRRGDRSDLLHQAQHVRRAPHLGDLALADAHHGDPEHEALLSDSVGLALLVVLETLSPAERFAFVLHDMFGVPFGEIAPIVGRSPAAARQLASRARRRVRGTAPAANGRSSTPSSPPREAATSTRSSRCSIRKSCSGQTTEPRERRGWSGARRGRAGAHLLAVCSFRAACARQRGRGTYHGPGDDHSR